MNKLQAASFTFVIEISSSNYWKLISLKNQCLLYSRYYADRAPIGGAHFRDLAPGQLYGTQFQKAIGVTASAWTDPEMERQTSFANSDVLNFCTSRSFYFKNFECKTLNSIHLRCVCMRILA